MLISWMNLTFLLCGTYKRNEIDYYVMLGQELSLDSLPYVASLFYS